MGRKQRESIEVELPAVLDLHCHGRGFGERHKLTPLQALGDANVAGIGVTAFMPNTSPAITKISVLDTYSNIIHQANRELGIHRKQYIYFGATDTNHADCEQAMRRKDVI